MQGEVLVSRFVYKTVLFLYQYKQVNCDKAVESKVNADAKGLLL
jgi:hypothetical protein